MRLCASLPPWDYYVYTHTWETTQFCFTDNKLLIYNKGFPKHRGLTKERGYQNNLALQLLFIKTTKSERADILGPSDAIIFKPSEGLWAGSYGCPCIRKERHSQNSILRPACTGADTQREFNLYKVMIYSQLISDNQQKELYLKHATFSIVKFPYQIHFENIKPWDVPM